MDAFGEMRRRRFVPEETTYSLLISLSSKHGKGEQALRLFEEMRGHGIVPSNYTCASLLALYYKEDIVSAEDTFRVLSTCGLPDVFCCNDLLRLYLRLGHLEKARALILKMREENFQLDEDLCMTVMEFYCKSSMVDDAEKLFKEIQRNGKTMKIATTISLIEMYARNRISMFLKEESLPRALDSTDSSAANIVLKSLLDMPEGLSNACQLISKLAREGDTDHAKFLYEQLTALGTKPDDSALATLIVQYGQNQQLEQAQELFQSASASSLVGSHVYNAMVDSLCKCGKTDEAYNLFMEMADQGNNRDAVTVSILVSHLTKHGKFQEAENIVHGCFRDEVQLDTVVYNTFIKLMLESGKLHSAVSIYERMISSGISPSMQTFNIMISVYGKGGRLDKAIETFAAAQELGLPIDEKSCTNMLSLYGKAGRHREASLLFDRMKEDGIKPGKISFNSMINAYATSGLHREARAVFQKMQDSGHAPDSLSYLTLIRAYTEGKRYKEAEKAIQMMLGGSNVTPSCPHFSQLIFAFLKEGQISEAQRMYNQMKEAGVAPDLACCRTMMRVYLEHGLVDEGISLFETTHGLLKPDSLMLSAAFHLYEHEGREDEAGEVLDAISLHGTTFLRNLKVGSKVRSKLKGS